MAACPSSDDACLCYRCPPRQALYFLSWPTLGSALILALMPSEKKMEEVSEQSGP